MLNTDKVREIMQEQKINTSQLGKKIGISPQHLSNILSGTRGISTQTLSALSQALDVPVSDIFEAALNDEQQQPSISISKDGSVVIEKTSRIRILLPPNEDSYEALKRLITENKELDNRIQELLLKADKETKEKILNMLETGEDKPD